MDASTAAQRTAAAVSTIGSHFTLADAEVVAAGFASSDGVTHG